MARLQTMIEREEQDGKCIVKKVVMRRFKHNTHLLRNSPSYECFECDGYNIECPDYTTGERK